MHCGSQVEVVVPADGAGVDENDFIELGETSRFGNFLRILLALGSSALVIAATFQSITFLSQQNLHIGYLTVVCALAGVVHILTVALLSSTSSVSNKTIFSVGCLISALSSGALLPQLHLTLSTVVLTAQRLIQEVGFAALLYALPALLWYDMPSTLHYTIPLLAVFRGVGIFFSPLLNESLEGSSAAAVNIFMCSGFLMLAVLTCLVMRVPRRSARNTTQTSAFKLCCSRRTLFTALMVFNASFTVTLLSLLNTEVFETGRAYHNFVLRLLPSGILYFLSGPLVAMFIRWLPPRGFVFLISTLFNIVLLVSLNYEPPYLTPITFGCLAICNGGQVVLLHMHLVQGFSSSISARHDIAAGRVISVTISLSCVASFLLPSWFKFVTAKHVSVFRSVYLCVITNSVVSATILVSILRELCTE